MACGSEMPLSILRADRICANLQSTLDSLLAHAEKRPEKRKLVDETLPISFEETKHPSPVEDMQRVKQQMQNNNEVIVTIDSSDEETGRNITSGQLSGKSSRQSPLLFTIDSDDDQWHGPIQKKSRPPLTPAKPKSPSGEVSSSTTVTSFSRKFFPSNRLTTSSRTEIMPICKPDSGLPQSSSACSFRTTFTVSPPIADSTTVTDDIRLNKTTSTKKKPPLCIELIDCFIEEVVVTDDEMISSSQDSIMDGFVPPKPDDSSENEGPICTKRPEKRARNFFDSDDETEGTKQGSKSSDDVVDSGLDDPVANKKPSTMAVVDHQTSVIAIEKPVRNVSRETSPPKETTAPFTSSSLENEARKKLDFADGDDTSNKTTASVEGFAAPPQSTSASESAKESNPQRETSQKRKRGRPFKNAKAEAKPQPPSKNSGRKPGALENEEPSSGSDFVPSEPSSLSSQSSVDTEKETGVKTRFSARLQGKNAVESDKKSILRSRGPRASAKRALTKISVQMVEPKSDKPEELVEPLKESQTKQDPRKKSLLPMEVDESSKESSAAQECPTKVSLLKTGVEGVKENPAEQQNTPKPFSKLKKVDEFVKVNPAPEREVKDPPPAPKPPKAGSRDSDTDSWDEDGSDTEDTTKPPKKGLKSDLDKGNGSVSSGRSVANAGSEGSTSAGPVKKQKKVVKKKRPRKNELSDSDDDDDTPSSRKHPRKSRKSENKDRVYDYIVMSNLESRTEDGKWMCKICKELDGTPRAFATEKGLKNHQVMKGCNKLWNNYTDAYSKSARKLAPELMADVLFTFEPFECSVVHPFPRFRKDRKTPERVEEVSSVASPGSVDSGISVGSPGSLAGTSDRTNTSFRTIEQLEEDLALSETDTSSSGSDWSSSSDSSSEDESASNGVAVNENGKIPAPVTTSPPAPKAVTPVSGPTAADLRTELPTPKSSSGTISTVSSSVTAGKNPVIRKSAVNKKSKTPAPVVSSPPASKAVTPVSGPGTDCRTELPTSKSSSGAISTGSSSAIAGKNAVIRKDVEDSKTGSGEPASKLETAAQHPVGENQKVDEDESDDDDLDFADFVNAPEDLWADERDENGLPSLEKRLALMQKKKSGEGK